MQRLLTQPDRATPDGRRDAVLLTVLSDTGARVQEVIDLVVGDMRPALPAVVTLTGKGAKRRAVPLMAPTVTLLAAYLDEWHLHRADRSDDPLVWNRQRQKLTRWGVTYILQKYVTRARADAAVRFPATVGSEVTRENISKAVSQLNTTSCNMAPANTTKGKVWADRPPWDRASPRPSPVVYVRRCARSNVRYLLLQESVPCVAGSCLHPSEHHPARSFIRLVVNARIG